MPQKSHDPDRSTPSSVPQEPDDELEMAEDDDDFEDEDLDDEAGADEEEELEE